jgi:hypothetical protein
MHECANCGRKYTNPVALQRCPCGNNGGAQTISFVSDVLSAPVAVEPEPTDAAKELYAYNASAIPIGSGEPREKYPTISEVTAKLRTKETPKHVSYYSVYGQERLDEMLVIGRDTRNRMPVLLIGPTGGGKSHMIRDVAQILGIGYKETNAYPGMDISLWFGMHRPTERNGFIGLDWQNGLLTEAALNGEAFFMEEATRAPQDALGRMFGPAELTGRYISMPEKGELSTPVHDDFWLIATANPATAGYAVQRMDKAFNSRFLIMRITEPVADETRILDDLLGAHKYRDKYWRMIVECRKHPEAFINTRDLIMGARLLAMDFDPERAVELAIAEKYEDFHDSIMRSADLHFNGPVPVEESEDKTDG